MERYGSTLLHTRTRRGVGADIAAPKESVLPGSPDPGTVAPLVFPGPCIRLCSASGSVLALVQPRVKGAWRHRSSVAAILGPGTALQVPQSLPQRSVALRSLLLAHTSSGTHEQAVAAKVDAAKPPSSGGGGGGGLLCWQYAAAKEFRVFRRLSAEGAHHLDVGQMMALGRRYDLWGSSAAPRDVTRPTVAETLCKVSASCTLALARRPQQHRLTLCWHVGVGAGDKAPRRAAAPCHAACCGLMDRLCH